MVIQNRHFYFCRVIILNINKHTMETVPPQLKNFFLSATKNSYSKFERVSTYHLSALSNSKNPFEKERYEFYLPFDQEFQSLFIEFGSLEENKQENTKEVELLLEQLRGDLIEEWDIDIQGVYKPRTSRYKGLLPNGRKPFQSGTQEDRIDAVKKVIENIGADATLASVKEKMNVFLRKVEDAQVYKKRKFSDVKKLSAAVEAARVEGCEAMFENYGLFIGKYSKTPELAAPYFDWNTLFPKEQKTYEQTLKGGATKNVAKKTLSVKQTITADNQGEAAIEIFSVNKKTGIIGTQKVTVLPGEIKTITAAEIGNTKETPFINILNTNKTVEAKVKVQIN